MDSLAYNYKGAYTAISTSEYWFVEFNGDLRSYVGGVRTRLNIDHVVELDMIVSYFTSAFTVVQGFIENQWNLVKDFIESQGLRAVSELTVSAIKHGTSHSSAPDIG